MKTNVKVCLATVIISILGGMFIYTKFSENDKDIQAKQPTQQSISKSNLEENDIIKGGILNIKIKDVISGDGKNKLGEYGVGYYPDTLTDDDLVNIYNNQIKGKNLEWVYLIDSTTKEKGYLFSDLNSGVFNYGKIDKTEQMGKIEYIGQIIDDSVKIIKK